MSDKAAEGRSEFIVADRAEAYYRLRKALRKEGGMTDEIELQLQEQWWDDVKPYFGYPGEKGWWL